MPRNAPILIEFLEKIAATASQALWQMMRHPARIDVKNRLPNKQLLDCYLTTMRPNMALMRCLPLLNDVIDKPDE
jgi:hypothetical protein